MAVTGPAELVGDQPGNAGDVVIANKEGTILLKVEVMNIDQLCNWGNFVKKMFLRSFDLKMFLRSLGISLFVRS